MTLRGGRLHGQTVGDSSAATAAWGHDEPVIGVDRDDNETGFLSRSAAHGSAGVLHRAFMVLLVDEAGRLLLCRRSEHKRLWAGCWADSCAGHPRPGEDTGQAARRRLREEVGCDAELSSLGTFVYRAECADAGCEHELCHVFAGRVRGDLTPDPAEVSDTAFFDPRHLEILMRERPGDFAPWLVTCLKAYPSSAFVASAPE